MAVFDAELLRSLIPLATSLQIGIIAVGDLDGLPITFTSRVEKLFGYIEGELVGKPFEILLPDSVKPHHQKLMESFKVSASTATRSMNSDRVAEGVRKNGSLCKIRVSISYHQSSVSHNFYLALIQDESDDSKSLQDARTTIANLLSPTREVIEKTRVAIAKQIAVRGGGGVGVISLVVWLLSQITPLGNALKAARTAFSWDVQNSRKSEIGVYEIVDDDTRFNKLILVRNALLSKSKNVYAVAYFKLDVGDYGSPTLRYITDSGTTNKKEAWFYDFYSEGNPIVFSEKELTLLYGSKCFLRKDAGEFPKAEGQPKFDVIFCSTSKVALDEQNPGLSRFVTAGVIGLAIAPNTELEPIASYLQSYNPSLENLFQKEKESDENGS